MRRQISYPIHNKDLNVLLQHSPEMFWQYNAWYLLLNNEDMQMLKNEVDEDA